MRTSATQNMEVRRVALASKTDDELRALKADLTVRLAGRLTLGERTDVAHQRDAIEWVEYERQLERGEPGRAETYTSELDAAQVAGNKRGVAETAIGARARLEGAYRTGGRKDALTTELVLGTRGTTEQKAAIREQAGSIEMEAATFKTELREQAKHTALGMLDQSSAEIEAALGKYGFVGGKHRLTIAAEAYNRDPDKLDQLVVDWRTLSDASDRSAATRRGDRQQAELAKIVVELRRLQAQADQLEREERGFTPADWEQRELADPTRSSIAVKTKLAEAGSRPRPSTRSCWHSAMTSTASTPTAWPG